MDNSRTLLTIGHLATTRHPAGNGFWSISGGRGGFPVFGEQRPEAKPAPLTVALEHAAMLFSSVLMWGTTQACVFLLRFHPYPGLLPPYWARIFQSFLP